MQLSQVSRRNYEGYFMHPNIYYSPSKIILLFVLWKNSGELKIINTNKTNPFYALDKRTKKGNYVIIKEITHSYFFSSKYKPFFNCYLVLTPKDWNDILEFNIVGVFFRSIKYYEYDCMREKFSKCLPYTDFNIFFTEMYVCFWDNFS